tara:strand:- start:375533 stop:376273 length:741 start_codon:yes stop_codon:yes gene_type:complete
MEKLERLYKIVKFIQKNYPDVNPEDLHNKEQSEEAILSTIKEFSGYRYDSDRKFFIKEVGDLMFATEVIELKDIDSLPALCAAIDYLNEAYIKRSKAMEQAKEISLPDKLYVPPKVVWEISRTNIEAFLRKSYGLESEKELFELEQKKQREVIFDLFRVFTGYTPSKHSVGRITFTIPEHPDFKLHYSDLPDFDGNTNLFSHIRDMRRVNRYTQDTLRQFTTKRMTQIQNMVESDREQNKNEDLER